MILVLRALGVGDLLTAVPAIRGLRAAHPDQSLALAAPGWLAPLVDLVGGVDELIPVDDLRARDWALPPPALAVNLHGLGPASHRLLQAAGPDRLLAFANVEAGHTDGPQGNDEEHEVWRWCRLLRWYGIDSDPGDLALRRPSPDRVPVGLTIVHPGAKDPDRRWPADRYARVASELAALGHHVVITGSADERELAEEVAAGAGLPMTAVLAGHTELSELAVLIAYGRVLVSGDTGVAHLATAYRTPSVLLFGPVPPKRWAPPPDRPWHRVVWRADLAGGANTGAGHPALLAIDPAEVVAAVSEVDQLGQVRDAVAAH